MCTTLEAKHHRISAEKSALLICDIQEKFSPHIVCFKEMVENCKRLIDVAALLNMKIVATEQYPKGLGKTVSQLEIDEYNVPVFEKLQFTMCLPQLMKEIEGVKSVILCGVECHVCILQTVLDMLDKGISVYVVADATSSRSKTDRFFGIRQMERAGAVVTTTETILLGLIGGADHPKFKEVQKIIKTPSADTKLLLDLSR
uniref:Isochorismatase domain-containing protein 1 n=1 Tax=Syphacia muris TaxID=451379 RepID=A0A0N5AT09_9BILA